MYNRNRITNRSGGFMANTVDEMVRNILQQELVNNDKIVVEQDCE